MRNTLVALLLLFSVIGCTESEYIDNRPAVQVRFTEIVRQWRDTVNAAGNNDGLRRQLLKKGVNVVKDHIKDSLQLQFKSWEARLLDVAPDPTAPDYIIASFGMNLDPGRMTEKTRYQSLVLTSRTTKSEPAYATLKILKVGDIVRISGNFITMQKTINIDSYNNLSRSKNVLDNPEFRVEIEKLDNFIESKQ